MNESGSAAGREFIRNHHDPIPVENPADGEIVGYVPDVDVEDALRAVGSAADALTAWRSTSPRERAEILRRCYDGMIDRAEELARCMTLENGKTLQDARTEVAYAAEFFRWYSEEAVRAVGRVSEAPSGSNRILVQYEPIGVALLITPWNFPAAMAARKIAPALAAGCTVVLKPATETPLTAVMIAEICAQAGVPVGVVNVVTTRRTGEVVSAMLADSRIRALSFTGSTATGVLLLKQAANRVLKTSMELGGNAPFIVFDDAELEETVDGLMIAKMRNGGQACTAANRVFAQRGIAEALASGLSERMRALRVGPGLDEDSECGPLIGPAAVEKVSGLVDAAVADGARVLVGGKRHSEQGNFYEPTVVVNVPSSSSLAQEEVFGPVASVITFDDEDEVVREANRTEFGLAGYVFTSDLARGLRVAERLELGMVGLNRGLVSDPSAPFGGTKHSGLGREGSTDGMLEFMEQKYIAVSW